MLPHGRLPGSVVSLFPTSALTVSGTDTLVFDIAKYFRPTDIMDMLVRNIHLGAALAGYFARQETECASSRAERAVVLMRGHGFTVQAPSIEECVLRAVYTHQNAQIQTTALQTHSALFRHSDETRRTATDIRYLDEGECIAATEMTKWSASRPWELWVREVDVNPLYVNQDE